MTERNGSDARGPRGRYLATLTLAALGVVYGDIGTSPLYAIRECFHGAWAVEASRANVLGAVSLIFWSLVIVISIKYLAFVLGADNKGEGGILVLMSLIKPERRVTRAGRWLLIAMGLFGAALLYGDGMITPAISVLGAVEGLRVATPILDPYVVPITVGILIGLFAFQHRGTGGVGAVFGPVTLLWFLAIATLGVSGIWREPGILAAVNPVHGAEFFARNGVEGFFVLGAVFLVVTGGEALYADLGHFGTRPIRLGWFGLVLPALLLNYFGQGALLLGNPAAADSPFYRLVPTSALYPMVLLATAATVIASQAIISGVFSLTRQAIQFGYSPRLRVEHTSPEEIGQIYLPWVNWVLMGATIGLVVGFGSSSRVAAAYGVAVTTTMVITTVLFFVVARERWGWSLWMLVPLAGFFLAVDLAFFGANIVKVAEGGWVPLVVAGAVFTVMSTWRRGREILAQRLAEKSVPLDLLLPDILADPPGRVPGVAVYMTGNPTGTPPALVANLTHNRVLHERVVLLRVTAEDVPHVPPAERVEVQDLGSGFFSVTARYGFMQDPNVPDVLRRCRAYGLEVPVENTTFVLGRETLLATQRPGMALWREKLFAVMSRNALRATAYFRIPPEQVLEIGAQVEL